MMNLFGDDHTPVQKAIWKGILRLVDNIPTPGGSSREAGSFNEYETDGQHTDEVRTRYSAYNEDGTKTVYEVTVTVRQREDSNDSYWNQQLLERESALVINGVHYRIGDNNGANVQFKGFGGAKFDIQYLSTGTAIQVGDLWYQGPIPPKHRDKFPDNARFINPEQEPFK